MQMRCEEIVMDIEYTWIRAKRKTIAIHVRNGEVVVRAPMFYSKSDVEEFVAEKEAWIKRHLADSKEELERKNAFELDYGSLVLYRGENYPIVAKNGNQVEFDGAAFNIPPGLPPEDVKGACVQLYRALAKRDLTERTDYFAWETGITPSAVKITGAKARWGSCSSKKSINFSWMLIMAENDLIDYVIVHELAHILEMNHSIWFWKLVETVFPDYADRKARLGEFQKRVQSENWDV